MDLRRRLRWELGRELARKPAALRALAALGCAALVWGMLSLGTVARQNRARFWLDQSSAAAREYASFRARFAATELHVLRLASSTLRGGSRVLTEALRAAPGVLEVVSASELQHDWRDIPDYLLPHGCDSSGACSAWDDGRWARARSLHGPLSERLKLLDWGSKTAHILVFARSQLDGAWGWNAPDPPESVYQQAERRRRAPSSAFVPLAHRWLKNLLYPLLFGAVCFVALRRHSWLLALAAVGTAALAAAASQAVLVATRRIASIAEPSAEFVVFVLVLGAALEVLSVERAALWLTGGENPWRAARVGAGRSALGLGLLGLASWSIALVPVAELQAFALQTAGGLVLGAALVSSLLPTLAALLPRQRSSVAAPGTAAATAAPRGRPRWERWALLGAVVVVSASLVPAVPAFRNLEGQALWPSFLEFVVVIFGLPLVLMLLRHGPGWLQRAWPLEPPRRLPEMLQRVLDTYAASFVVLYAIALPFWLTAAPGSAARLGPEPLERWDGLQEESRPYSVEPLTRVELVLTTPRSQLTEAGLARLERLAARLVTKLPLFGVIEPSLLLREAAFQGERSLILPGPWLTDTGVIARVFAQYVTDQGRTTRMTLLAETPLHVSPVAFAAGLPLDSIAQQVKQELPEAALSITGPERFVAEAAFDPLRLSALLVLALALASAFQRLTARSAPPGGGAASSVSTATPTPSRSSGWRGASG